MRYSKSGELNQPTLRGLHTQLDGDLLTDQLSKIIYATDGSFYEKEPLAVCLPKSTEDLVTLARFASKHGVSLIPRTAGTSLGGQCVGEGIVVDVSKYFNRILEVNAKAQWVVVQPGVVRDELNKHLAPYGLFFGVNTSTSNRAMIGGMVGNNSSGSLSITYGTTRDNVLELKAILSNGEEAVFSDLDAEAFKDKKELQNLEGKLYRDIDNILRDKGNRQLIDENFPKKTIHRKNTGYALDVLADTMPFGGSAPFNFSKILCGSEGTLCFFSELKLRLNPLPPPYTTVVCAHFHSLNDTLKANLKAMSQKPYSCELMDKIILDCTKKNTLQSRNRFFVVDDPAAILVVEFRGHTEREAREKAECLAKILETEAKSYACPLVAGKDVDKIWELRSAGLGVLANFDNSISAVESIEDTAVDIIDLPNYIEELDALLKKYGQNPVYYAHAGAGELHVRPTLNLKEKKDVELLKAICKETFKLVKKYNGSISGEHGDGIVRSEFIKDFYGEAVNKLLENVKYSWDKDAIFNRGKIVHPYPMAESIKHQIGEAYVDIPTMLDFSADGGMLSMAEKCTGSGDCRKSEVFAGVMCPSFMAARDEKNTTRARANALRKVIRSTRTEDIFKSKELDEVLDLCLSCKGCTSECPSNVDMAALKSEYLYQKNKAVGTSLRSRAFAYQASINTGLAKVIGRSAYNKALSLQWVQKSLKATLGIHTERKIPQLSKHTLRSWFEKHKSELKPSNPIKTVYIFCDEFTNELEAEVGIKALLLLSKLGYALEMPKNTNSGRAFISKGFLKQAKRCAVKNVALFSRLAGDSSPVVGIEPSSILTFRDEYPKLLRNKAQKASKTLSQHVFLIDEFLSKEHERGAFSSNLFTDEPKTVLFHGHCHQKAISVVEHSLKILRLPKSYTVLEIPSGCCGMAGSFGYEKEHFELSKRIFNLVLGPFITKNHNESTLLAATGTSCREQIFDFSNKKAQHPVEILYDALV